MGKIIRYIVNIYNLKTVKEIYMGSKDTYTFCYWQYICYIIYGPWGHPQSYGWGNYLKSPKLLTSPHINHIYSCSLSRGTKWRMSWAPRKVMPPLNRKSPNNLKQVRSPPINGQIRLIDLIIASNEITSCLLMIFTIVFAELF